MIQYTHINNIKLYGLFRLLYSHNDKVIYIQNEENNGK